MALDDSGRFEMDKDNVNTQEIDIPDKESTVSEEQIIDESKKESTSCIDTEYQKIVSRIDSCQNSIEEKIANIRDLSSRVPEDNLIGRISGLESILRDVAEKQDRNDRNLVKTLRENANFQIQVRQGMQEELEQLKEQQRGFQFNPILKDIAAIYVEYHGLLADESIVGVSRNNLNSLFEQLQDILSEYGAEIVRSSVGERRNVRNTKIIEMIPTSEQEKHNTIAVSRSPGVMRGNLVLYHEFVDVFVYDCSKTSEVETYSKDASINMIKGESE